MAGRLRNSLVVILLLVVVAGAFALYSLWTRAVQEGPPIGSRAPGVRLVDMVTGEVVSLPKDLSGEAYAMIFFMHSCPACRDEAVQLQYAKRNHPELRIIFIAPGSIDDQAFMTAAGHEALFDPTLEAFSTYGVITVPRTFFIDRQGVIHDIRIGWTRDSYQRFVETLQELTG